MAALEEVALKVGAQAVADDGDAAPVHDVHELLHLRLGEKLRLIDDEAIVEAEVDAGKVFDELAGRAQPRARADRFFAVAAVEARLEKERVLAALAVVVLHHDGVGGLGGAHRSIAEIEFGHVYPLWQLARRTGKRFPLCIRQKRGRFLPAACQRQI